MATYNPAIPNASDLLSTSQQNIKDNFTKANTSFGINHYAFSDATANNGKHKFVELVATTLPAGLVSGEGTLYAKTIGSVRQLFYTPDNSGNEYQLTRTISASFAKFGTNTALPAPTSGNGGWVFLPGNLLLQYGSFNPNISTTVKFPISFTNPPFCVQLTGSASNNSSFRAGVDTGTLTSSQFDFEGSVSSSWNPIYFIAIGV